MEKHRINRTKKSNPKKRLQKIARLNDEKQELEKKYMLVSSKLDLLKNRMQNLNHDLRSPLGGITGMIDLLLKKYKDQIDVQTRNLNMIKESAQSIFDLINGSLGVEDTQKSLNENIKIDRVLSSVIFETNRLYLPMAQNKGISLSLSTQIDTEVQFPPNLYISLIQITGNLIANAIKFTPSNGSVYVVFNLDADENQSIILNMTVADTGKSMSPDQVSAFKQNKPVARSMGTNGEQGFGIGLQHVIQMVSEVDGRILVKSEKGLGSIFSLSFPLSDENLTRKDTSHFIVKNGEVILNGSQG